jgi:methylase of polypeptide subunit release factors
MGQDGDAALEALLGELGAAGYRFVTVTPATHARVVARRDKRVARDRRDMLGWSLPFAPDFDPRLETLLAQAGMIAPAAGGLLRSALRVSSLDDMLFLHSAYPTTEADAVFFGPDSYRFADLIATELAAKPLRDGAHIVDFGAGSGVGGIVAGHASRAARVTLVETNPKALRFARINARAAGIAVATAETLDDVADLIVINPPYIADPEGRAYRDGGGMHGGEAAVAMTRESTDRLARGGRILLYTGAAIVDGHNLVCEALAEVAAAAGLRLRCRELDPDVFGEELDNPAYAEVERIALIAAVLERA